MQRKAPTQPPREIHAAIDAFTAGRPAEAEQLLRRALAKAPAFPDANHLLALCLLRLERPQEAEFFADRAVALAPAVPEYLNTLGLALSACRKPAPAAKAFTRALELRPAPALRANLAQELSRLSRFADAEAQYQRGLADDPSNPECLEGYADLLLRAGRADLAGPLLARALPAASGPRAARLAVLLTFTEPTDDARLLDAHRRAWHGLPVAPAPAAPRPPKPSLRIAVLSPDLRRHSVTAFLEPILAHRTRHLVYGYHTATFEDEVTARLRASADGWRNVAALDDRALADQIRRDGIDVVLDLAGLLAGNRLLALAQRPAPLVATYLGYPCTTGMPAVDVRLVDHLTDPPGAEAGASERLVRMDGCFLCYQPPADAPPPAVRSGGPVVFGTFNAVRKITAEAAALWGRILAQVPGATLLLKSGEMEDPWKRGKLLDLLAEHGIPAQRCEIRPFAPGVNDHLAMYGDLDVALDTFPYNGTTTTCEALSMGVPVVMLAGRAHRARVGVSLAAAAGVPDLVAPDPDAYVALAVALANDPARRADLRASLRPRLLASPLCDARAAAARFEDALDRAWASC